MSASAPDIGVPVLPGRPTLLTAEYDDPLRSPKSAELLALPNARRNRGSAESGLSGPRDDPPDPPTASLASLDAEDVLYSVSDSIVKDPGVDVADVAGGAATVAGRPSYGDAPGVDDAERDRRDFFFFVAIAVAGGGAAAAAAAATIVVGFGTFDGDGDTLARSSDIESSDAAQRSIQRGSDRGGGGGDGGSGSGSGDPPARLSSAIHARNDADVGTTPRLRESTIAASSASTVADWSSRDVDANTAFAMSFAASGNAAWMILTRFVSDASPAEASADGDSWRRDERDCDGDGDCGDGDGDGDADGESENASCFRRADGRGGGDVGGGGDGDGASTSTSSSPPLASSSASAPSSLRASAAICFKSSSTPSPMASSSFEFIRRRSMSSPRRSFRCGESVFEPGVPPAD